MENRKIKIKKLLLWLVLLAFSAVVVGYTSYLISFGDMTTQNLSVIGAQSEHEKGLQLWGWITGLYFVSFMIYLIWLSEYRGIMIWIFTILAGIFLVIGVYIPFRPEWSVFWSNVHIGISLCAPLCLLGAILLMEYYLKNECRRWMDIELKVTYICMGISLGMFLRYMIVTSLLEIFVVSACTLFLNWVTIRLIFQKDPRK